MPRRQSDAAYKKLFSSPRMVRDLLRGFVADPWLDQCDGLTLRRMPEQHISDVLRALNTDMVYEVAAPDGIGKVLIHIEFQSTKAHAMPLRMVEYGVHIVRCHLRQHKGSSRLGWPPLLSIVIYNGLAPWRQSNRLSDRFRRAPCGWLAEPPEHKFVLIDLHRQNLGTLDKLDNVVALVMRIEQTQQPHELTQVLVRLKEILAHEHELREDIRKWALAATGNRSSIASELLHEFAKPEGTVMNLEEKFERWGKELSEQSRQEGRQEGHQEGRQEALRRTMQRLIAKRFGALKPVTIQRIQSSTPEQLEIWLENIVDAKTLDQVFRQVH